MRTLDLHQAQKAAPVDEDSYQTPQRQPAPTIQVLRDPQHPSHVVLPIVD